MGGRIKLDYFGQEYELQERSREDKSNKRITFHYDNGPLQEGLPHFALTFHSQSFAKTTLTVTNGHAVATLPRSHSGTWTICTGLYRRSNRMPTTPVLNGSPLAKWKFRKSGTSEKSDPDKTVERHCIDLHRVMKEVNDDHYENDDWSGNHFVKATKIVPV